MFKARDIVGFNKIKETLVSLRGTSNIKNEENLKPEFQKIFNKIKEQEMNDPIIYSAFTRAQIHGLNDFETILIIAECTIRNLTELQKSYVEYINNDTRPIIIKTVD